MNGFDLTRKQANALVNSDRRASRAERIAAHRADMKRLADILARRKAQRAAELAK